jgi:hypothetical protein
VNIDSGQVVNSFEGDDTRYVTVPKGLPGRWITANSRGVRFIKSDFSPGKPIWTRPPNDPTYPGFVDIDPLGEWVGWSVIGAQGGPKVAIKQVAAPTAQEPYYSSYPNYFFTLWTDDGNMLLSRGTDPTVIIMNKEGNVVRKLTLPFSPAEGDGMSWRRYRH